MDAVNLALLAVFIFNPMVAWFIARRQDRREIDSYYVIGWVGLCLWCVGMMLYRVVPSPTAAAFWYRFVLSVSTLIPISLQGYTIFFPYRQQTRTPQKAALIWVPAFLINVFIWLPWTIVGVTLRPGLEPIPHFGQLYLVYVVYIFLSVTNVALDLLWKLGEVDQPLLVRQQIRFKLVGVVFPGSIGVLTNVILPIFEVVQFNYVGQLATPFYSVAILYALVRYRFTDLDQLFKRSLVYFLLSGLLTGAYLASVQFLHSRIALQYEIRWGLFSSFLLLIFAFLFQPLRDWLQGGVDRLFGRRSAGFRSLLRDVGSVVTRIAELERLAKISARLAYGRLPIIGLSVYMYDRERKEYACRAAFGNARGFRGIHLPANILLPQILKQREMLVRVALEEELHAETRSFHDRTDRLQLLEEMIELKAMVAIPSFGRVAGQERDLLGFWIFGEKRTADLYTSEELQILIAFLTEVSVATENALLYESLREKYTELRAVQEKLFQAEKMAALGTMAAGIAHEIKNPLAAMKIFTGLPLETLEREEYREKFVQVVVPEIDRLDRIVTELLQFSRPAPPHFESMDPCEVVEKALRLMEVRFKRQHIFVERSFHPIPSIFADPGKLMQILMNLFSNAIQAMPHGGHIGVRIWKREDGIRMEIWDTGTGIAKEHIKDIFNPFYTTRETGTGLGLSITQRIVEEHRGRIWAESEVGKGTSVFIDLPLDPARQMELLPTHG